MTPEELAALPEQGLSGSFRVVTNPQTGESFMQREPVRFLVNRSDVYAYRDASGTYWTVGEDVDGRRWKMRAA